MRNWLIYEPASGAKRTLEGAEAFVTVREGFSKVAFLVPLVWLIYRRCWVALAIYVVAEIAINVVAGLTGVDGGWRFILAFLPNLAVGLEAAWLRARVLERRGYRLAGTAMARSREEAEALFFQEWIAEGPERRPPPPPSQATNAPYRPAAAGVLGLFPEPGAAR